MPRFSNTLSQKRSVNEDVIDVYDCSQADFWTSNKNVDLNDGFYRFSLKMDKGDYQTFEKIHFSKNNKFISIHCKDKLFVYDHDLEFNAKETPMCKHNFYVLTLTDLTEEEIYVGFGKR